MILLCTFMLDNEFAARFAEFIGYVTIHVICENPFSPDAITVIQRHREQNKLYRRFCSHICMNCSICHSICVIHTDMEVSPTRLTLFCLWGPGFLIANLINLAKALSPHGAYPLGCPTPSAELAAWAPERQAGKGAIYVTR